MKDWLRKLDNRLFSPPHTFQTILAFVAVRLSLSWETDGGDAKMSAAESPDESPERTSRPRPT